MSSLPRLSASKIKSYSSCSYLAYLRYNCGLPSSSNTGAILGSVTHSILECLANPKRATMVDDCLQYQNPFAIACIERYAKILLKKENELSEENLNKVNGFLLTAIENDFYGKGCLEAFTEYEFNINNGKYWIYGFIDKMFVYEDSVRILDFKTSKDKFKGEDLNFNVQALMYTLVAKQLFPNKRVTVEFLFLKFRKNPYILMEYTDDQILGFESYLEYISEYLQNFGIDKALANMASSGGKAKNWMCGKPPYTYKDNGDLAWTCEYRAPFLYFEALKDGVPIKSAFTKKELDKYAKLGYTIVQRRHAGCPRFH